MTLELSHFSAALIFAFFTSIVFGITQRSTPRDQVRYGVECFIFFIVGMIIAGWLMWLLRR
ncbi:MAG TPA: hypothetical protein VNK82_10515 [Terriglobales bacterium]|nr:hypothetical protein [Terriglobales bacterium]